MPKLKSICVYCGSSNEVKPAYIELARALGRSLAQQDLKKNLEFPWDSHSFPTGLTGVQRGPRDPSYDLFELQPRMQI